MDISFAQPENITYGTCACSGVFETRVVEIRFTLPDGAQVSMKAPQGACPLCGSRVYKTEVLKRVEDLFRAHSTRK